MSLSTSTMAPAAITSAYDRFRDFDPELYAALSKEQQRQEEHIELIASENYASKAVMQVAGSCLTNKYAEGYPGKRYYGGCEYVDIAENLAIERAKKIFKADYANVQPHSGSNANAQAFMAMVKPGDTVMGMSLAEGGHLTHGASVSFSGRMYHAVQYGINHEGLIDYDQVLQLARQHRPKMIIAGFSAYSRIVDWAKFREIADDVGAYFLADIAHVAGLVAAGLYPSPVPYADVVTTTTHKTLRGPRGGLILAKQHDDLIKKLNFSVFPGLQGGPLMHIIAAKALAFKEALQPDFVQYQQEVLHHAKAMADTLMHRGVDIVSGGTENHLLLINLISKKLTGKRISNLLGEVNITVNKNAVPKDPESPFVTSGIRIGTPAITTRGFKEKQCRQVADWIADIIEDPDNAKRLETIKEDVALLCKQFPVYQHTL